MMVDVLTRSLAETDPAIHAADFLSRNLDPKKP